jgi:hypothetical protein
MGTERLGRALLVISCLVSACTCAAPAPGDGDAGPTDPVDGAPLDGAGSDGAVPDGSDHDAGLLDPAASPETVHAEWLESMCELGRRCEELSSFVSSAMCRPGYPDLIWEGILDAWRAGTGMYDPARGRACLEALSRIEGCPTSIDEIYPVECLEMVVGTVPEGGACYVGHWAPECQEGLQCIRGSECPGRCEPWSERGEPCDGVRYCAPGLSCDRSNVCVGPALGEPCDEYCGLGLVCAEGACVFPAQRGEACDDAQPCSSPLQCGSDGHCEDPTRPTEGEPCEPFVGCAFPAGCVRFGEDASSYVYRCVNGSPLGQGCGSTMPCGAGGRCVTGVCRQIVASGAACDASHVCPVEHDCTAGTCIPWPTVGEACTLHCFASSCVDGICSRSESVCGHRALTCPAGTHCAETADGPPCAPTCE